MKHTIWILTLIAAVASAWAQPAPYPLRINSRAATAPPATVFAGSEHRFELRFTDDATASDYTGHDPFLVWWSAAATGYVAAAITQTSPTAGVATATFTGTDLNYAAGRYTYEAGFRTGGVTRVSRQGVLTIIGSLAGTGAELPAFASPLNWSIYTEYIGTATHGPYLFDASTFTTSVDATGRVTVVGPGAVAETDPIWGAVSNTVTTGAALGATALQSFTELDPLWVAVSNTVTEGAALGATSVQTEIDPVWGAVSNTVTAGALAGSTATQPNAITGTDPLGTIVNNGQVTEVGAGTPWTGVGYLIANAITGTDPVGTAVVDGQVTGVGTLTPWTGEGYITGETDPFWSAWVTNAPLGQDSVIRYTGELVPALTDTVSGDLHFRKNAEWVTATGYIAQAETAYGWGNHANAGYLTTESDPVWGAVSNTITTQAGQGATAHGWGNHATNNYTKIEPGTATTNLTFWTGTETQYSALSTTNAYTVYFVKPDPE